MEDESPIGSTRAVVLGAVEDWSRVEGVMAALEMASWVEIEIGVGEAVGRVRRLVAENVDMPWVEAVTVRAVRVAMTALLCPKQTL